MLYQKPHPCKMDTGLPGYGGSHYGLLIQVTIGKLLGIGVNPILHYALGLHFSNVCAQKRKENATKRREKSNKLAFLTNVECNNKKQNSREACVYIFLAVFSRFVFCILTHILDTNMLVSKTLGKRQGKTREK